MPNPNQTRHLLRLATLLLLFPLRFLVSLFVMLFDMFISRCLVALPVAAVFWLPLYLLADVGLVWLFRGTIVLGTLLAGLWDGCSIYTLRPYLPKWLCFEAPLPLFTGATTLESEHER